MKKYVMYSLWVFVLLLASCGVSQRTVDETTPSDVTDSSQDQTTQEQEESQKQIQEDTTRQDQDEDTSLSGYDLLRSIDVTPSEKLYIEATTNVDGTEYSTKMTLYKDSMRVETQDEEGMNLMIYDSTQGITYMYNSQSGQGMMYRDDDEAFETDAWVGDEEAEFEADFDASYFENLEGLTQAEFTTLDGMEVLYMEIVTEMGETDYISKEWISTKYWYPLKTEVYFGEELTSTYRVTTITDTFTVDETTFAPPEDIEFMDVNQLYEQYDLDNTEGVG